MSMKLLTKITKNLYNLYIIIYILDICETKQKKQSNIKKQSFFKYQFRSSNKKTKNYTTNNPEVIVKISKGCMIKFLEH